MKKYCKKLLSVLLVLCVAASMVVVAIPSAQAGLISNILTGNFKAIALGTIERVTTTAISKAASAAEDDTVAEILSWTSRILSGYQSVVNRTLIAETESISLQLDEMYSYMTAEFDSIEDKLNQLIQNGTKTELQTMRTEIKNRAYYYEGVVKAYDDLFTAFVEYGKAENPTVDDDVYKNLKLAYDNVYKRYSCDFNEKMLDTKEEEMFIAHIFPDVEGASFINKISSYNPNAEIHYDNGKPVLTDEAYWQSPDAGAITYLDLMFEYAKSAYNFESNVYSMMVSGANELANVVSMYASAYKYYVQFNTYFIENDIIAVEDKESAIGSMNRNFEDCVYKMIRALNQMCQEQEVVFTTYMRPYDTTATLNIKDYKTQQSMAELYGGYSGVELPSGADDSLITFTIYDYQNPQVEVHQFKLVNEPDNTVYAIKTNTLKNTVGSAARYVPEAAGVTFSLSMFNFLRGTTNGLSTIKSVNDISNITGNNSSYHNNTTLINNIKNELSHSTSSVKLDSVAAVDVNAAPQAYMLLDSDITWEGDKFFAPEEAPNMNWIDVSKTNPKEVLVDAEDDVKDSPVKNSNLMVMYKGAPRVSLDVNSISADGVSNGTGEVYIDGKCVISDNGFATNLESSKAMELKITPDYDSYVSSVVLKNSNGGTIGTLYEGGQEDYFSVASGDSETGYKLEFIMPVLCQDAVIEVTYDNVVEEYKVTLESLDKNTTLSFEDSTETEALVEEYKTVNVNIVPDESYIVGAVRVLDTNGNEIKCTITEADGAKLCSFTMPESDVSVTAGSYYDSGYDFIINNYEELCEMRDNINSGVTFELDRGTVSANECRYVVGSDFACPEDAEWIPVANVNDGFGGSFDGRGYKIEGLRISDASIEKPALFETVGETGLVKNLNLDISFDVSHGAATGGITSENLGTIENCSVSGEIRTNDEAEFSESSFGYIGSIASANSGKIVGCSSSCQIYAGDNIATVIAGGIVGLNISIGEISNSSNTGTIESYAVMNILGGISGMSSGIQTKSFNSGNIITHGWINAGGISGYEYKGLGNSATDVKVAYCYNTGDITAVEYSSSSALASDYYDRFLAEEGETIHLGGLFGNIENTAVRDLYSCGNINNQGEAVYAAFGIIGNNLTADNYYYLADENAETVGENQKNKSQFESGEVAYLLNKSVTDGTQVWYQNIDNGETPDAYPVFEGGTVYKSAGTCIGEDIGYTNNPHSGITHNYNNYHVCKDCISLRPGEAAGIYGFSIGLGGNISVKYYMVLDEEVAADETAKMIFTVPDTGSSYDIEIPVSEAQVTQMTVPATGETRTIHIFECEVAAKEMTSDIYCQVVTDTRESDVFTYNVKEYADVILTNSESFEREVPLVKAMLNYGAYAQLSFDYNTKNLANTSEYITEEEKVLTPADFSSYGFTLEGEEEAISYYGSAISLKSETAIKHYFYFENDEDVENTVVTVNGEKVTPVKNGGYYEIKVSDIPAHMLNENYEVKVGDITLNYSVFSYCNVATGKANDQKLIDVANALYAYNQAAIDYIG